MVKKMEAKEQLQHTSRKHRGLVLKSSRPISSYRYPRFTVDDVLKNRCPNFVRPIDLPNPFRAPSLTVIASYGIVEREKRTKKPNRYYNSYDYLLGKDKLSSEINKKSKQNKNETKNKGFALTMNRKDLTM
ncbi:hypothetical protein RDI58_023828 [Solanum bulbocastanum]|uniref:Uncharacterized protein n=1 Tax=Solanum bulbocastanum TaxID=147425 RepID=A0AAN8T4N4_SOLBU